MTALFLLVPVLVLVHENIIAIRGLDLSRDKHGKIGRLTRNEDLERS